MDPSLQSQRTKATALSGSSGPWTGTSVQELPPVHTAGLTFAELRAEVATEARRWSTGDPEAAARTVESALDLACRVRAGCLFVVAPNKELAALKKNKNVEAADNLYLTRRLRDAQVWSDEFARVFVDFATKTHDDRWPMEYPEAAARGLPKDGAMVVSASGQLKMGAAKLVQLPPAPNSWPKHGTRHRAALEVAHYLDWAVVIIRSENHEIHVLIAHVDGRERKSVDVFQAHAVDLDKMD